MAVVTKEVGSTVAQSVPTAHAVRDRDFALTVTSGPDKGKRVVLEARSARSRARRAERGVRRAALRPRGVASSRRLRPRGDAAAPHRSRVHQRHLRRPGAHRRGAPHRRRARCASAPPCSASTRWTRWTSAAHRATRSRPRPLLRQRPRASVGSWARAARSPRLYPLFERLASATVPVVIEGETGTGKEALAEAIHEMGPRAKRPFVIFDCTAVPPALIESELFGHERGAFTGAVGSRRGVFEQAHGGTLFIDEIGDLDLTLQPKLLRAIERSEVRRVGGDGWLSVDVRIVAATRRDLDREVEEGRFREDLFHRLARRARRAAAAPSSAGRRAGAGAALLAAAGRRSGPAHRGAPGSLGSGALAGQRARAPQRGRSSARARRPSGSRCRRRPTRRAAPRRAAGERSWRSW